MLKVVVVLATANAFLAPVTQRPATIMQAATIAAKDVSALRKASGASQCTHEEVPSIATSAVVASVASRGLRPRASVGGATSWLIRRGCLTVGRRATHRSTGGAAARDANAPTP